MYCICESPETFDLVVRLEMQDFRLFDKVFTYLLYLYLSIYMDADLIDKDLTSKGVNDDVFFTRLPALWCHTTASQ